MDHSIKTALGIKDVHLELDTNTKEDPITDHGDYIVVHLIQSYPMHCPHCGHLMMFGRKSRDFSHGMDRPL